MDKRQTSITFTGGALGSLGYSLLFALLFVLLLPGAWGAAALSVWWCANLRFSDGTQATFQGDPRKVWVLFAALALLTYLPTLATTGLAEGTKSSAISGLLSLILIPFEAALKLPIYRWAIESIRLEPGGNPRFTGTYVSYLGWIGLLILSILTIIGWAWAAVAMIRWFCRNTQGNGFSVEFTGTGGGLLWRGFVWTLGVILIIPIPWVLRASYAWFTNNLVLVRGEAQPEYQQPNAWA